MAMKELATVLKLQDFLEMIPRGSKKRGVGRIDVSLIMIALDGAGTGQ